MVKTTQEDIRKAKYEKKKTLEHEFREELCAEDKCVELKRKLKKREGEEQLDD